MVQQRIQHEWIDSGLDAIQASPETKDDACSKRDQAFQKAYELQDKIISVRKNLEKFMEKNDLWSVIGIAFEKSKRDIA